MRHGRILKPSVRVTSLCIHHSNLSTESPSFVNVIKENGYSVVEMNRKPVNSLSLEMNIELASVIEDLEADPTCQGMILTSVSTHIYHNQSGVIRKSSEQGYVCKFVDGWINMVFHD